MRKVLLDLTQKQLADQIGVKRGAVTNWERGGNIGRKNASKITELAGVTLDWLLHGRGERPLPPEAPSKKVLSTTQVIAITVEIMEGLRKLHWSDREKILVAEKIREFSEEPQSSRVSQQTAIRLLELDIRRALEKETPKSETSSTIG